jgi:predicted amidophosphoribosyltransferase
MARVLADLLAMRIISTLDTARPDYIVPMPLHAARLRERGFNQALEIARRVSKNVRVPLLPGACERDQDTSQTQLPWKARGKMSWRFAAKPIFPANIAMLTMC